MLLSFTSNAFDFDFDFDFLFFKISSYLPKFFYQHKLIIKWQLKTTTSLESLPVVIL